jgi:hypothetical protein
MSVAQASPTKINNEGIPAHRVRDVRTFQRYAAAVILPPHVSPSVGSFKLTTLTPAGRST